MKLQSIYGYLFILLGYLTGCLVEKVPPDTVEQSLIVPHSSITLGKTT